MRALVIGDTGDPESGDDLPGARREALRVGQLLSERGAEVEALIGAPTLARDGPLRDIKPASRVDALISLERGGFDLLHYVGPVDFDPEDPSAFGLSFPGGLLIPSELEHVTEPPVLVVANACLPARSTSGMEQEVRWIPFSTAVPSSLADEFFRLGVGDIVNVAWEINDNAGQLFAGKFYDALFPTSETEEAASIGEAVRQAREALWADRDLYGSTWAAYQHYTREDSPDTSQ